MSSEDVENPFDCELCSAEAEFFVQERWEAEDGLGAVESDTPLCAECASDEGPRHLDQAYANYEFRIEPVPEAFGMTTLGGG
jgi:acyl dehydratase